MQKLGTPQNANVKLLAQDQSNLEHDIIQNGWGSAQGDKIGGKDAGQTLNVRAIFSDAGNYKITFKLIDRDNSDAVIAQETFDFDVKEETINVPEETVPQEPSEENNQEQNPETGISGEEINENANNEAEMPKELPKTGNNIYVPIVIVLGLVLAVFVYYNKKTNKISK